MEQLPYSTLVLCEVALKYGDIFNFKTEFNKTSNVFNQAYVLSGLYVHKDDLWYLCFDKVF